MKKILVAVIAVLFVFVLSSCSTEDVEITIMIYSENPEQTVSDLEKLPEVLSNELLRLGYNHDRILLQSSDEIAVIETSLEDGTVDIAIIDPSLVQSENIVKRLSVRMEEINHPDGDEDPLSYQMAIVSTPTVAGESLKTHIETNEIYDFTELNVQDFCSLTEDQNYVDEFAIFMGMTSQTQTLLNVDITTSNNLSDLYSNLKNGTCDAGIVRIEDIGMYQSIWDDVEETIYDDLTVLHIFDPISYDGIYVAEEADVLLSMTLIQAFIHISAHSGNQEIQEALGYDSFYIPE